MSNRRRLLSVFTSSTTVEETSGIIDDYSFSLDENPLYLDTHEYWDNNSTCTPPDCTWLSGNYTTACYDVTNNTSLVAVDDFLNYWSLVLLVFPMLTIFGNVLVVMSVYRERSLQTVTNYYIVSLAVADVMVATFVMPLSVYVEVCHFNFVFSIEHMYVCSCMCVGVRTYVSFTRNK